MAIDCCHHVLAALKEVPRSQLSSVSSERLSDSEEDIGIDLIAVGIPKYPMRRFFVSQLRKVYANVPILILRRERVNPDQIEDSIRGEFMLSDQNYHDDCEIVRVLRQIMPFEPCEHGVRDEDYEMVRAVVGVLANRYSDPTLNLTKIAREVNTSPKRLSVGLNQRVGVSFRQMLRQIRLEEAKRMLQTGQYSVKEVAARAGFADSHYFSRSFKEFTGQNPRDCLGRTAGSVERVLYTR